MRVSASPFQAKTVSVSASTTSATGTLAAQTENIVVSNPSTTSVAFVRFSSTAAPTAVTTDFPVVPGSQVLLTKPKDAIYVAVILDTGTATVYFSPVQGA